MAVFELTGADPSAIADLAVGPWTCASRLVAFDAGSPTAHPRGVSLAGESVWRVELSRDLSASRAALAGGERSVARTHAELDDAPRRFDRALEQQLPEPAPAARSGPAEAHLIAALAGSDASLWLELESPASVGSLRSSPASPPVWSSPDPRTSRETRELGGPGWLGGALDRIADLARGRARIETRVEGVLVAHSLMTLSGDTEVWTAPRLSTAGAQLHARSVAIAVHTRHAWARILALIVRSTTRILTLGLPAAAAAALPLAWRFVRDVLRDLRDRDAARSG